MSRRVLLVLSAVAALSVAGTARAAGSADAEARVARTAAVQQVVDGYRARLAITAQVVVSLAPNDLIASVGRSQDRPDAFDLLLDDTFLSGLDADELDAAIAHELGHVWIFTHHPYLQTEELANSVALKLVPRSSLEHLYRKVWMTNGKGDLQYLPAIQPQTAP
jgi:hypothetical protein